MRERRLGPVLRLILERFPQSRLRTLLMGATALFLSSHTAWGQQAPTPGGSMVASEQVRPFSIDAQPLTSALTTFSRQSGQHVALNGVQGHLVSSPVHGLMTPSVALRILLQGTGVGVLSRKDGITILGTGSSTEPLFKDADVEKIRVQAIRDTTTTKRTSAQIIDTLTAAQIRTIPDITVVQAAKRIVGVSIMPNVDYNRGDNSAQNISIRGFNNAYNLITLDGAQIASANSTYRGARLDLIPSSMLGELQILKTVDAYNDPQGIGGQVNMVTKNALDYGNTFDTQLLGGWNNTSGTVGAPFHQNWRVDGTVTRVFGKDKAFGLLLSGSYQELYSAQHAILPGDSNGDGWTYYPESPSPFGNNVNTQVAARSGNAVSVRVQDYLFDDAYKRYSLAGKFQYRASKKLDMSIFAAYFHTLDNETMNDALSMPSGTWAQGSTPLSGSFSQGQYQDGVNVQPETQRTWVFNGKLHYNLTDRMQLSFLGSDSIALDEINRNMIKYNTGMNEKTNKTTYSPDYGYTYNIIGGAPYISINNLGMVNDPENYGPRYWRYYNYGVRNTVRFLRGDWKWNIDDHFWMNVGATQTLTHVRNTETYMQWLPNGEAAADEIGNMDQVLSGKTVSVTSAPGVNFNLIDYDKALAKLQKNPSLFKTSNTASTAAAAYYLLHESITAAYFQTGWHNRYVSIQGGMRWDHTNLSVGNNVGNTQHETTIYSYQTRHAGYDFFLPSVLVSFKLTPEMKLRTDFTETIGRPNYGSYGSSSTSSFNGASVTISQGNPDLQPRHSWNYDLAWEWYPQKDTLFSLGLFYKDLHNEIYTRNTEGTALVDGQVYPAIISEPLNATGAGVRGLELQMMRQKFGFLPGRLKNFGLSFNATFLQGFYEASMDDGTKRRVNGLQYQPGHIYNASLFYNDDQFQGRIAYNLIGKSLYSTSGTAPWLDQWLQDRGQLDLQLSYRVNKWLSATGQVQNLLGSHYEIRMGPRSDLIQINHPVGRIVWLGLRFQPDF